MDEPRYYVRYQCIKPTRDSRATHYAYVQDSWYCHWDVARFEHTGGGDGKGDIRTIVLRAANTLADQWNAEHDALLSHEGTASR